LAKDFTVYMAMAMTLDVSWGFWY